MGELILMRILVDVVVELNIQMNMMIEWDIQISVMNVMGLVLYYGCFLDHQTILG